MCPLFRDLGDAATIKGRKYSKSHATLVYIQQAKMWKLMAQNNVIDRITKIKGHSSAAYHKLVEVIRFFGKDENDWAKSVSIMYWTERWVKDNMEDRLTRLHLNSMYEWMDHYGS